MRNIGCTRYFGGSHGRSVFSVNEEPMTRGGVRAIKTERNRATPRAKKTRAGTRVAERTRTTTAIVLSHNIVRIKRARYNIDCAFAGGGGVGGDRAMTVARASETDRAAGGRTDCGTCG